MVVLNRFSKTVHFLPCQTTNDASQEPNVYFNVYFQEVMRLHGIPKSMVSNRDRKLMSHFWLTLWKKLGTHLKFSTSCRPQMDSQIEVTNRTLCTLLRALVNKNVKGWDVLLSHVEFAFNRTPRKATSLSPFLVGYGSNPCTTFDLTPISTTTKFSWKFEKRVKDIQEIDSNVRERIEKFNE